MVLNSILVFLNSWSVLAMMQAVVITQHGGLDVFAFQERPIPCLKSLE